MWVPGQRLGPYEVLTQLGSGGMGDVFLGRDTRLGRRVALKTARRQTRSDVPDPEWLLREARATAALNHPNIAAVYDIGESDGVTFIAIEYVPGQTLARRIQDGPLSASEVISVGLQVAEGLRVAHSNGIVHRDLKPANLMLTPTGTIKVLDFGIAAIIENDAATATQITSIEPAMSAAGALIGTAAYMSPEQTTGAKLDGRTDLFALGAVLYEAATGHPAFCASSIAETIEKVRRFHPDEISRSDDAAWPALNRIIYKCLAKAPAERYDTADQLLADLQTLTENAPAIVGGRERGGTHNFPADLTSFIGRTTDVLRVRELLRATRLLTLAGAGGCGKTRLAQRVAQDVSSAYPHGAWFIDLAQVREPELLISVVGRALGIPEKPGTPTRDVIIDWLRGKALLLVLDNCEHMIEECAGITQTILRAASRVSILATSREALGVPGETVWRVPSLLFPDPEQRADPPTLLAYDAIRLFVDRAAAATGFTLTVENSQAVGEICRRLDGVPLAIELAAARVSVLSVEQIAVRLRDRFRLLTGASRTAVARQRTLQATVDWSYDLLGSAERVLFDRLAVFSGGWTLEAAEHVCSETPLQQQDVLALLSRLVDKCLVIADEPSGPERRYRFLETIRQYGRDRLVSSGEVEPTSSRHFHFWLSLARRAAPELIRAQQVEWFDRLEADHDNLRAALEWAAAERDRRHEALELATLLWWFWTKRAHFREGRQRLEAALNAADDAEERLQAHALVGLMHLAAFQGDLDATRRLIDRGLTTARRGGSLWAESFSLGWASILASEGGEFERSRALAEEARVLALRCPLGTAHHPLGLALRMLGYAALQSGDLQEAARFFQDAISLLRQAEEPWSLGILLSDLGALRLLEGEHAEAGTLVREALTLCAGLGDRRGIGWCLQTIATVKAAAGKPLEAATLYGAAQGTLDTVGSSGQVTVSRVQDRYLALARAALGSQPFDDAVAGGRALPLSQAVDRALSPTG